MSTDPIDLSRWIVCDLDGTLSNDWYRRPHLPKERGNRDYAAYYKGISEDAVVDWIRALIGEAWRWKRIRTLILTARPEQYRRDTETWLNLMGVQYHALYMRPEGNIMPSEKFKYHALIDFFDGRMGVIELLLDNNPAVFAMVQNFREPFKAILVQNIPPALPGHTFPDERRQS